MKRQDFLRFLFLFLTILFSNSIWATPKEIIIIRHADKWVQTQPGPCLSPKGLARSIAFAFYFLDKFGEPDVIVATHPKLWKGEASIRELQTVAPLANILAERRPNTGFPIQHSYSSGEFNKLAQSLLKDAQFDHKKVLVCWNHTRIPALAVLLGVNQRMNKWPGEDFDSVYILDYDANGALKNFTILNQQYPIVSNPSWKDLSNKLFSGENV